MTGSASTARCSGRTVTHPADAASTTRAIARALLLRTAIGLSEVHTETSFVHLGIAIRVFREDRQVVDLEANEDAQAKSEQNAAARSRRPHGFLAQDELIDVRKRRQASEPEGCVRLDRPLGREVKRE